MGFTVNFNAANVAPSTVMEAVPTGIYTVAIDKSEEKAVKDKPGNTYGQFSMRIQEGEQVGKYVIARLNLKNDNPTAMEIAQAELSAICHVTGVIHLQNTQELHGRPFKVNVVKVPMVQNGQVVPERYSNEIRGYLDMNGNPPGQAKGGGGAAASNAGDFGGTEPEAKKETPPPAPKKETPPPAPSPKFPPDGWTKHPEADGYYYKGQEVLTEADLRKRMAADAPKVPAAPAAPAAPAEQASGGADDSIPDWAK